MKTVREVSNGQGQKMRRRTRSSWVGVAAVVGVASLAPLPLNAEEDRCVCGDFAPRVVLDCGPEGQVHARVRDGARVQDLSAEDEALVFLAYEIWDGTRYQDMRCDERGRMLSETRRMSDQRRGVYALFEGITDLRTDLAVLGPGARMRHPVTGREAPLLYPLACAGPRPTVVVGVEALRRLRSAPDGEAFLAFALAHELGHRATAFTPEGDHCQEWARKREGWLGVEQSADARAMFYAALAGYRVATIANGNHLKTFLESEGASGAKERQAALMDAISEFEGYAGVYQTAITLGFMGSTEDAIVLLDFVDEMMRKRHVEVPEVKMALAMLLIMRNGPEGPWLRGLPGELGRVTCDPVFSGRPAMSDEMGKAGLFGALRGSTGRTIEDARRELESALRLLSRAQELGVSAVAVKSAMACANLYLGNAEEARRLNREALSSLRADAPANVRAVLAANGALMDFYEQYARNREKRDWLAASKKFAANALLAKVLECIGKGLKRCEEMVAASGAEVASVGGVPLPGPVLPAAPAFPPGVGQCPGDWERLFSVPDQRGDSTEAVFYGVTGCVSAGSFAGAAAVHVRLMGSTRPPHDGMDVVVMLMSRMPQGFETKERWARACTLTRQGVSDAGEEVYKAVCAEGANARTGVLFVDARGRAVRFGWL